MPKDSSQLFTKLFPLREAVLQASVVDRVLVEIHLLRALVVAEDPGDLGQLADGLDRDVDVALHPEVDLGVHVDERADGGAGEVIGRGAEHRGIDHVPAAGVSGHA